MKKFAIVGAAGYIAPRHLKAIQETGNEIVAAVDVSDSVGILDSYSQEVDFFTSFDEFENYLVDQNSSDATKIDYVSICSPNHLHAEQSVKSLLAGSDVICEKPLVIDAKDLSKIQDAESKSGSKLYNVLQLRLHPSIVSLKERVAASEGRPHSVDLTYITSRGKWYHRSWKGQDDMSGGIAANIGIHFFDMLLWIFGQASSFEVVERTPETMAGRLTLEKAEVSWKLSIDRGCLPDSAVKENKPTFRSIKVDDEEFEFSGGFTDLHTRVYEDILSGGGYGVIDATSSIKLVERLMRL